MSCYASYYNQRYGYHGHVFEGRFKSCIVKDSLDLLKETSEKYGYSARVIHKLLRLARTSADLDGAEKIRFQDTKKVISCRDLDESNSKMMVVK